MRIEKINNSYTEVYGDLSDPKIKHLTKMLTLEKDGWQFDYLVRIGRADKFQYHFERTKNGIRVASGILELPYVREVLDLPEIDALEELHKVKNVEDFENFREEVSKIKEILKTSHFPIEPRDYQELAAVKALAKPISLLKMCTGSGKSFTISLLLEYFRREGLKGALIVPNINLLTQFANDIKSYNLLDLHKSIIKFGGQSKKTKDPKDIKGGELILTTWQSLRNLDDEVVKSLDFIICDEVHRFSSECTSKLVLDSVNAKYKLGFTGTLPESKNSRMVLLGLFGIPFDIIDSADLIERDMGTPIRIHSTKLVHNIDNSVAVKRYMDYLDRVKFISKIPERNSLIAKLSKKLSSKARGSTLILYTLIDHGIQIYKEITGEEPGTLERQKELKVFFMEGSVKAKEREEMRVAMDEVPDAIMIANYSLLSTGVNIKSLRYAIFASPLKSYTAIVQSLGRGIRKTEGKEEFEVWDIVDSFPGSIHTFENSSRARKKIYTQQKFQYDEKVIKM